MRAAARWPRGFHFFVLDDDGRIRRDYPFAGAVPPA
jgi:hypothetical protein